MVAPSTNRSRQRNQSDPGFNGASPCATRGGGGRWRTGRAARSGRGHRRREGTGPGIAPEPVPRGTPTDQLGVGSVGGAKASGGDCSGGGGGGGGTGPAGATPIPVAGAAGAEASGP